MLSFTVLGQDCGFEAEKFRQLSTATYGRGHQLYMGVTISSMWAWSSALYGRGHQLCCRAMCYEMLHICQLHIHDAGIPLSTISPRHLIELRFGHYLSTVNFNNPTRGDLTFVTGCAILLKVSIQRLVHYRPKGKDRPSKLRQETVSHTVTPLPAGQLHSSLTSPSTMQIMRCSGIKHTATGLWTSRDMFSARWPLVPPLALKASAFFLAWIHTAAHNIRLAWKNDGPELTAVKF